MDALKSATILVLALAIPVPALAQQSASMSRDPLDPIAPTSQAECTALGNEWDQRIKVLERAHDDCMHHALDHCKQLGLIESSQCQRREGNPLFAQGKDVSPYLRCEPAHQAFLAAIAGKVAGVKRCRDHVNAAANSNSIPVIPPSNKPDGTSFRGGTASLGERGGTTQTPARGVAGSGTAGRGAPAGRAAAPAAPFGSPDAPLPAACQGFRYPRPGESIDAYVSEISRNATPDKLSACFSALQSAEIDDSLRTPPADGAVAPPNFRMPTFGAGGGGGGRRESLAGSAPDPVVTVNPELADAAAAAARAFGSTIGAPRSSSSGAAPVPRAGGGDLLDAVFSTTTKYEHPVTLIAQQTDETCWSAAAAMLLGKNMSVGIADSSYWNQLAKGSIDLDADNIQKFAGAYNLRMYKPQSWTVSGFVDLLQKGPIQIWETYDGGLQSELLKQSIPRGYRDFGGHAVIVNAVEGNGTADGTWLTVYDPLPVGKGTISRVTYKFFMTQMFPNPTAYILQKR